MDFGGALREWRPNPYAHTADRGKPASSGHLAVFLHCG
jgi:hypothetical protein